MSEVERTQGDWHVSSECDEIVVAEDSVYGVQVADCGKPKGDQYQPAPGEAAANAKFIAIACKSHDHLLAALKAQQRANEADEQKMPFAAWLVLESVAKALVNAAIAKAESAK